MSIRKGGLMRKLFGALFVVLLGTTPAFATSPRAQELIDRAVAPIQVVDRVRHPPGHILRQVMRGSGRD